MGVKCITVLYIGIITIVVCIVVWRVLNVYEKRVLTQHKQGVENNNPRKKKRLSKIISVLKCLKGPVKDVAETQNKDLRYYVNVTSKISTIRIVIVGIIVAVVCMTVIHFVYLGLKKIPTVSAFNESDTIGIILGIFTAVTAIMIYHKQTVSTEQAQQEASQHDATYRNTLQQYYGVCLRMEIQTKISDVLQKANAIWQDDSVQSLCLKKDSSGQYHLYLTLSTAVRSQNVFNTKFTCDVQYRRETNIVVFAIAQFDVKDNSTVENDMRIPKDILERTLDITINENANVTEVHNVLLNCIRNHTIQEVQIQFKNLQHAYLKVPIQTDNPNINANLSDLIDEINDQRLRYSADIHITLCNGAVAQNAVNFVTCQTWRADVALLKDCTSQVQSVEK